MVVPEALGDTLANLSRGSRLASGLARDLTSAIENSRRGLSSVTHEVRTGATRVAGYLAEVGGDMILPRGSAWGERIFSSLGIASVGSLQELDERIVDVEYKIDEVGRGQVARELLLLRQRVGELESVISDSDDRKGQDAIHLLVDRLGELESRIDTLPWPTIDVSDDVSY
jgi:hypothetical protein